MSSISLSLFYLHTLSLSSPYQSPNIPSPRLRTKQTSERRVSTLVTRASALIPRHLSPMKPTGEKKGFPRLVINDKSSHRRAIIGMKLGQEIAFLRSRELNVLRGWETESKKKKKRKKKETFHSGARFFPEKSTGTMLRSRIGSYEGRLKKVEGLDGASREIKILVLRWGHRGNGVCIILINRLGWRQTWLWPDGNLGQSYLYFYARRSPSILRAPSTFSLSLNIRGTSVQHPWNARREISQRTAVVYPVNCIIGNQKFGRTSINRFNRETNRINREPRILHSIILRILYFINLRIFQQFLILYMQVGEDLLPNLM